MPAKVYLPARRKYRNQPTVVDGVIFHSKKEAAHYQKLRILLKAGKIFGLELQPSFDLQVGAVLVCRYVADFRYYFHKWEADAQVNAVIEDVKGVRTREYKLKKKLMWALHGIAIQEV